MKRIDAFIQADQSSSVLIKLKDKGYQGVTINQGLGRGSGERPWIGGKSGHEIEFNAVNTITLIVDDSKVESVIKIIASAADTGNPGDGKIFILPVDDAYDIHSKQRGTKVIAK